MNNRPKVKRPGLICPTWLVRPAYHLAWGSVVPFALALSWPFLLLKEKRREAFLPRLGFQPYPKLDPAGPGPVWIHALSVGEVLSAVPLIEGLQQRLGSSRSVVVSVSTASGRWIAEKRLKGKADGLFYFPYDTAFAYRRCISRIRPALFVLIETDVWPGSLGHLRARGVPCLLVNGRLSDRSLRLFSRWWGLFGSAFGAFDRIYPQSARQAGQYLRLGVGPDRLGPSGNLKYDARVPSATEGGGRSLRAVLGLAPTDRILIGGSTHPGEELHLLSVFARLRAEIAGLKLVLVPRDPGRGGEVRDVCRASGFETALLTDREAGHPDVVVVDRLGFLSRFYSLAEIAFVGGSLVPKGGQNPIEPALAGKPIIFGPDMGDFSEIAPELIEAGGARMVVDRSGLLAACSDWLRNPQRAAEAGRKARQAVERHRGMADRLESEIMNLLERAPS